ncbi:hypothetical protein DCAR_0101063 [Daucus carota subsp. sativus]|uniref:Uncharacterized protein n=1 Tax=Daucus carota subsp. sativus TaxID=79200 RepID=A0A175YB23_DAUCS|nr:hypothetical protein DCAR_0101063 [Daucus carota subsp. sativus]
MIPLWNLIVRTFLDMTVCLRVRNSRKRLDQGNLRKSLREKGRKRKWHSILKGQEHVQEMQLLRLRSTDQSLTQKAPPPQTQNAHVFGPDNLPPPPPLTADLPPNLPLREKPPRKVRINQGIGTMEAFLEMRKSQKESSCENRNGVEGTGQTANLTTEDNDLETPAGS